MSPDKYYLADNEVSLASPAERQKLTQRLRQYLELQNVSVLMGNGGSIPLGAPVIGDTKQLKPELQKSPYKLTDDGQQASAIALLNLLLRDNAAPVNLEYFLGVLGNIDSNASILPAGTTFAVNGTAVAMGEVRLLITLLKKWLYLRCLDISDPRLDALKNHRELIRRLLLRSTTLPRAKLFTTNYDLILEHALDSLGVVYLDGFTGTIKRTLQTQSYHYDLYFPGETTEGHVSRVDRVLHLYKLHGSINWRRNDIRSIDVTIHHGNPSSEAQYGDVMIYPSPLKATEIHGYPYSEMFRHFSTHINRAQSVLFAIGYAFQDEHINRLIYQALNIPSFTLVIVIPEFAIPADPAHLGPEHEIWRLIHQVKSNRIVVITGGVIREGKYISGAGTLQDFATAIMPDISELDISARVAEEAQRAAGSSGAQSDGDLNEEENPRAD
jgi:hypothetical protein